MFNLSKFIASAVTYRPASMFEPDIQANRDALTRGIRGRMDSPYILERIDEIYYNRRSGTSR